MKKWHQKPWATWLFLVLFFPVGLVFLWKNKHYSTKANGIITAVVLVFAIIVGVTGEEEPNSTASATADNEQEETDDEKASKESEADEKEKSEDTSSTKETLTAKDGLVVVMVDGVEVFDIKTFQSMDAVKELEKEMVAQAEQERKEEQAQKEKEKKSNFEKEIKSLIENSNGVISDIDRNPYGSGSDKQWVVMVSDAWYNSPDHEKKRFAKTIGNTVEKLVKKAGIVERDDTVLVDFWDTYGEVLAEEGVWTGEYELKN